MKKNLTTIIVAAVALVAGYGIGALTGNQKVDNQRTSGDINRVNTYNQLLLAPENMVFSESEANNEELRQKTLQTLEIEANQNKEFCVAAAYIKDIKEAELAKEVKAIVKLLNDKSISKATAQATEDAMQLGKGEKINFKNAQKAAQTAYDGIEKQLKAGHAFVQAVDAFLAGKNVADYLNIAAARDMMASCCSLDATLCANDAETDFWSNINDLLTPQDMAIAITGEDE